MSSPLPAAHELQPAWEIAKLFPAQGAWSVEDYLALTDDTRQFVEFTSGNVEVLAMPTIAHQRILMYLLMRLREFVDGRGLGEVLPAVLRVQVAEDKFREPDIVFVRHDSSTRAQLRYWSSADLVMEIVSDDHKSQERDHVTKRRDYAAAGITEYWIVDPLKERVSVLGLDGTEYKTLGEFAPGQQAVSQLLEGFSVDVAATFQAAER